MLSIMQEIPQQPLVLCFQGNLLRIWIHKYIHLQPLLYIRYSKYSRYYRYYRYSVDYRH